MKMSQSEQNFIKDQIRKVPNFPREGILFWDITTLVGNYEAFKKILDLLTHRYSDQKIDFIAGAESRAFIFGAPLADRLGCGFVPIRKPGKLPSTSVSEKYSLEYGVDEVQIHMDAFETKDNARVIFIDDLLATGGTASASARLIRKVLRGNGELVECCFVIEISELNGKLSVEPESPVFSVLEV